MHLLGIKIPLVIIARVERQVICQSSICFQKKKTKNKEKDKNHGEGNIMKTIKRSVVVGEW